MKKVVFSICVILSLNTFASDWPSSRPDVREVSKVVGLAAILHVGEVFGNLQTMITSGASDAEINAYLFQALKQATLLRKFTLVGLAYVVGDYTGTKIYENLPENEQDALGEIISIMIENTKANLGIKTKN